MPGEPQPMMDVEPIAGVVSPPREFRAADAPKFEDPEQQRKWEAYRDWLWGLKS